MNQLPERSLLELGWPTRRCRSCDQQIRWIKLQPNGKRHPIDAEPTDDGNIRLMVVPGGELEGVVLSRAARADVDEPLYRSHFASCPQSDQWRTGARG